MITKDGGIYYERLFKFILNRVLAASLLPLGKDTLVYGSSDGGKNIATMDNEFNMKIELVAKSLNLQGEYVWNSSRTEKAFLYLSCDIEGHLGKDNRYYLVDTARLTLHSLSIHFLLDYYLPVLPSLE